MPKKKDYIKQIENFKIKEIKIKFKTKDKIHYVKVFVDGKEAKDFRNFIIKGYPHELTMELNYYNPDDFKDNFFYY